MKSNFNFISYLHFIFLFAVPFDALSQSVFFSISQELLKEGKKHGIFVSDNDGVLYYSNVLYPGQIQEDFKFLVNKEKNEKLNLTVFSQHYANEKKYGKEHFFAYTYLNVKDSIFIKKPKNTDFLDFAIRDSQLLKFNIADVKSIQEVFTGNPRIYGSLRYKVRKNNLKIELNKIRDIDLFMIFRANHENYYRYIYIPSGDSIPQFINYNELPTDLIAKKIELPEYANWWGYIRAINEDTQNLCYFFLDEDEAKYKDITILFPERYFFYNFQVFLQCASNTSNYRYSGVGDRNEFVRYAISSDTIPSKIEKINDINIQENYIDFDGFIFNIFEENLFFLCQVQVLPDVSVSAFGWDEAYISEWHILGEAEDVIAFKKPFFPAYITSELNLLNNLSYSSPISVSVFKSLNDGDIHFGDNPNKFLDIKWLLEHNIIGKIETIRFR